MEGPAVRRAAFGPVLTAAAVVVLVAGLRAAAPLLRPLLLALFLAVLSLPMLRLLLRQRVRPALAVSATVLADIALLTAFGFALSAAVNGFAQLAPGYIEQLARMAGEGLESLRQRGFDLATWLEAPVDPGQFVDLLGGILGRSVKGVASAVSYVTVVVVALVFLLVEMAGFPAKLNAALGRDATELRYLERISGDFQRYLGVKTLVSVATGVIVGVWVSLLGLDFALLWGLVAFLLNYIPVLGSILAAVPAVLLSLVQLGGGRALLVAAGYLAVNFLIGNLLEPALMGRRFGISPLVVLLALVFWAWVLGPLGMILAVPLTMAIKIALEYSERLSWLAVLLEPAPAAHAAGGRRAG